MVTRVDRTCKYRDKVNKAWHDKYWSFIENNINNPWDLDGFSCNPNLTMEIINANPDKPWRWYGISCNPNITMADIKANPNKPWNWNYISQNPNLTMEMINANPDKPWGWDWISRNKFTKSKVEFITQKYREYLAAYRIQQWWHRIRMDPRHPVGIRRLEREYTELFGQEAP